MSYKQAMKWHKKHPRGGKPQYMGFDSSSPVKVKTEQELRDFYPEYVAFHKKQKNSDHKVLTIDEYVKARVSV